MGGLPGRTCEIVCACVEMRDKTTQNLLEHAAVEPANLGWTHKGCLLTLPGQHEPAVRPNGWRRLFTNW